MTASQSEKPLSHAIPVVPMQRMSIAASGGSRPEMPIDESPEEWQIRLLGLQELICELLIKNQRLRAALLEATSASPTESQAYAV